MSRIRSQSLQFKIYNNSPVRDKCTKSTLATLETSFWHNSNCLLVNFWLNCYVFLTTVFLLYTKYISKKSFQFSIITFKTKLSMFSLILNSYCYVLMLSDLILSAMRTKTKTAGNIHEYMFINCTFNWKVPFTKFFPCYTWPDTLGKMMTWNLFCHSIERQNLRKYLQFEVEHQAPRDFLRFFQI